MLFWAHRATDRPLVVIAHTVKGKGVPRVGTLWRHIIIRRGSRTGPDTPMRNHLVGLIGEAARSQPEYLVFDAPDLGFSVVEPLQESMGPRFINAGIAEVQHDYDGGVAELLSAFSHMFIPSRRSLRPDVTSKYPQ